MKHFSINEFTKSQTALAQGLANTPTPAHMKNINELVHELLDPLREAWAIYCANEHIGTPALIVTSGYRGFRLNEAVGGSQTSAHCIGYAADLVPRNGKLREFKTFCREWLKTHQFDQMISESEDANGIPRWIHLGLKNSAGKHRKQFLTMRNGKYYSMSK